MATALGTVVNFFRQLEPHLPGVQTCPNCTSLSRAHAGKDFITFVFEGNIEKGNIESFISFPSVWMMN